MWEWLLSPIDPSRPHEISAALAWHGRAMVLAWGVLAPVAVVTARYFKVLPGQNWPQDLDNQFWWRSHWMGQVIVLVLSLVGLVLVLPLQVKNPGIHGAMGSAVLIALFVQIALGVFRGSKGGPTAPAPDGSLHGDHYNMTPRRRWFEALHKTVGYALLLLSAATILVGLSHANGPNWMWVVLLLWWLCLCIFSAWCHRRGMAVGSYQAIWGDDARHPGNTIIPERGSADQTDRTA